MNPQLATSSTPRRLAPRRQVVAPRRSRPVRLRAASSGDAPALHALVAAHLEEGHLLPRALGELSVHAPRFIIAEQRGRVVGCAELAPLSGRVAEVRSLVVARAARGRGLGRQLVAELHHRAQLAGFEQLCAFAHDAGYFVRMGFSIVPHSWVPDKIARDCTSCALFRQCGQHAVVLSIGDDQQRRVPTFVPLGSLGV